MGWMLTASLLLGSAAAYDAAAQTRKGAPAKKPAATATAKKGTSNQGETPIALTAKDVAGKLYFQMQSLDKTTTVVNLMTFNADKTVD